MNENELSAAAKSIKEFSDKWPYLLGLIKIQSKICYGRYKSLREEGFDRVDALQLCVKSVEM